MLHFVTMVFDRFRASAAGRARLAQAQGTYPDRPIRFVIAFPPGGATDTFFRQIIERAQRPRSASPS